MDSGGLDIAEAVGGTFEAEVGHDTYNKPILDDNGIETGDTQQIVRHVIERFIY